MKALQAALWMEILKTRKSAVFKISVYFFIFIGIMMGLLMYLSMHPEIASRSSTMNMKSSFIGGFGWKAFYGLLLQLVLSVGVIGSGIITSWAFGHEFADRVIKDLLALPVSRSTIVISKLIVLLVWSILLMLITLIAAFLTGALIRLPEWAEADLITFLKSYLICSVLIAFLITPVAFVASAGRGYMLAISFVILIMILTQLMFVGFPALAVWFPWALPAIFSGVAGPAVPDARVASFILYGLVVLAGMFGTIAWWRYGDHK
jgi:ABC-2 type transport system permease protein